MRSFRMHIRSFATELYIFNNIKRLRVFVRLTYVKCKHFLSDVSDLLYIANYVRKFSPGLG